MILLLSLVIEVGIPKQIQNSRFLDQFNGTGGVFFVLRHELWLVTFSFPFNLKGRRIHHSAYSPGLPLILERLRKQLTLLYMTFSKNFCAQLCSQDWISSAVPMLNLNSSIKAYSHGDWKFSLSFADNSWRALSVQNKHILISRGIKTYLLARLPSQSTLFKGLWICNSTAPSFSWQISCFQMSIPCKCNHKGNLQMDSWFLIKTFTQLCFLSIWATYTRVHKQERGPYIWMVKGPASWKFKLGYRSCGVGVPFNDMVEKLLTFLGHPHITIFGPSQNVEDSSPKFCPKIRKRTLARWQLLGCSSPQVSFLVTRYHFAVMQKWQDQVGS